MNKKYSKTNSEVMKQAIKKPVCMGSLTEEEIDAEIEQGRLGEGRPAEDVFEDIKNDY